MKEKLGELINLYWDTKDHPNYVKGHCSLIEVQQALLAWDDKATINGLIITHKWAKYVRAGEDDGVPEGRTSVFRTSCKERKGWFKVTECVIE